MSKKWDGWVNGIQLNELQASLDELETQLKRLKEVNGTNPKLHLYSFDEGRELVDARKRIIELEEALGFYADKNSWMKKGNSLYDSTETIKPTDSEKFGDNKYIGGKRARKVLHSSPEEKTT